VAAQIETAAPERVALLGREDEVRAQLRAALTEVGAEIVHEGDPREVDSQALKSLHAGTLIVNLDAGLEDAIDHLDPLFDDPDVQVIFNDSEVTQKLSGWDLARWARHLVAKVLRRSDATPPPPPGFETLPLRDLQPEPRPRQELPEAADHSGAFDDIAEEARLSVEIVPASRMPDEPAADLDDEPLVMVDLEPAEAELDFELASVSIEKPLPQTASAQYLGADEVLEIDDFELVPHDEIEGAPRRLGADEPTVVLSRDELHEQMSFKATDGGDDDLLSPRRGNDDPTVVLDLAEIEAGLEALGQDGETLDVAPASSAYVDPAVEGEEALDGDDFQSLLQGFDDAADAGPRRGHDEDEEVDLSLDEDVAALAAQLDALSDNLPGEGREDTEAGRDDFSAGDFDIDFDLPDPDAPPPVRSVPATPAAESAQADRETATDLAPTAPATIPGGGFGELSLLDLDAELGAPSAPPAQAERGTGYDFDSLGFSLSPIDGETPAVAADVGDGQILRVVVLGASIGGPDALRSFLGAIPAGFPALFILVQHLENGFFARLAQQLQKASALTVRVIGTDDAPARMGEVLVLPSDARYSVQRDGSIQREEYASPPRYKPCIDDAFRAAADVFGRDTLAVIFSGMAGDAVEGASHVTAMGGEVWGQDPQSCVVSSMIDGAQARGLLEVVASPRELGEQVVTRFARS
jgi:chemotaxis response regulator CheB